jgi:hypothetical protein
MQPEPIRNDHEFIVDIILRDSRVTTPLRNLLLKRKQLGEERYGTPLQAFNGRDALTDALEEAMDLCIYLMQLVQEAPELSRERSNMLYQYDCALSIAEALTYVRRS